MPSWLPRSHGRPVCITWVLLSANLCSSAGNARTAGMAGPFPAARRGAGNGPAIPVIRAFTALEMSLALGRPHVIHAALLAGRASQNALDLFDALARFHSPEPQAGGALLLTDSAEPSAEQQSV